jgi:hypothetical protein
MRASAVRLSFLLSTILIGVVFLSRPVIADDDSLLPVTFQSFAADYRRALAKASLKDALVALNCLDGSADKRKVCMYKLGNFFNIIVESQKGGSDVIGITMICSAPDITASSKCLLSYIAAMALTSPEMSVDTRGKIVKILLDGLEVGNITSVTTDDRKFILQKSIGLWFHIIAANSGDD